MILYSPTTRGFYDTALHRPGTIPADAVAVSAVEHAALLAGQAEGKAIAPGNGGRPAIEDAPEPPPSPALTLATIAAAVQAHLDAAARARDYESIQSAVTYADEPAVPLYPAEGIVFRAWRSLVWARCYALLAEVQAGLRDPLTPEGVVAELPALALPDPAAYEGETT